MKGGSRRYFTSALSALTLGRDEQAFLDARWTLFVLHGAPRRYRRRLALSILSASPHYFYRQPAYAGLSHAEYVEREYERNLTSRQRLGELILQPHLAPGQVVLDYGCGPGFLVRYVAGFVRCVHGVDISRGALECARILNAAPNASFLHVDEMTTVGDATVDLAYSVAVAQHLTDESLERALGILRHKLKPGGRLLLHVVLDAQGWRTEAEWRSDVSVAGRMKLKYGLHCFTRSERRVRELLEAAGFGSIVIGSLRDMVTEPFDDVCTQHLVSART